jgi:DNA-binding CsgD family transcriptional regulator/signal transduction histidine kinase
VTLFDLGREGNWHYLVLEHIPGQNLHARMVERGGVLTVGEALPIIRGALAGLGYAHGHGVIHRDVKPENIMVMPSGTTKVTDFGLALSAGEARLTRDDALVGTAYYMAPETIAGGIVDGRADLYAIGTVLYEMLTGRPPFAGNDTLTVISQILHAPVTEPRVLNIKLPDDLEVVLMRLLAKSPDERYASANEVLAALPEVDMPGAETGASLRSTPSPNESSSLLERIVRSSSATHPKPEAAEDDERLLTGETRGPVGDLLVYAAMEDTAEAVEAERRRLAGLLQGQVIESINLLLSQANVYEQTIGANPQARMAVSVLSSLARQLLQQVRDMEANLHPAILESMGLEPALEALASQEMRARGIQVVLDVTRLRERLPHPIELALFRAAQDALERAAIHARASQVIIRLVREDNWLTFGVHDNGLVTTGMDMMRPARVRIEALGGQVEMSLGASGVVFETRFLINPPVDLTPREIEVLRLLAEGLSNKEMAALLYLSERTVKFHLVNIYSKLGVNTRTEAAIYALRHGLARRPPNLSERTGQN